jgi:hypothetical protein
MNESNSSNPARIEVHWRRFSSGLWRVSEGDISAAYCADTFPKVKVFTHEGRLYANCGCCYSRWVYVQVDAYPLVPADEYSGPEPRQFTYEGREAKYGGRVFRLGPKVVFVASDPSIEEWRRLIRVLYADGGMFASECTYHGFLTDRFHPESMNGGTARANEITMCGNQTMPQTQHEMRTFLENGAAIRLDQLALALE